MGLLGLHAQTLTSYDLNPGTPGSTPVPQGAVWDAATNQPFLKFHVGSFYFEVLYSDLEALRNGTISNADFYIKHGIKLRVNDPVPLRLFRSVLNFSDTKGLFIVQANNTVNRNYLYRTPGKTMLTTNPSTQLTLDDLTFIDSVTTIRGYLNFKDKIVISAGTPAYGIELMVLDSNYTANIIDINTNGTADATPQQLFNWGDSVLLFQATDGTNGVELWRSNGTTAGTMLVKDINVGGSSSPEKFYAHGGKVYFSADDGAGKELWVTDGTNAGTTKVADLNGGSAASPNNLTSGPAGLLYFSASNGPGRRLYKTDGTQTGTVFVTTAFEPANYSFEFLNLSGHLYFMGTAYGDSIINMYRTDGTDTGTEELYRVYNGTNKIYGVSNPFIMAKSNGFIYFTGNDSIHNYEVYRTDGTTAGTIRATDFAQASSGSNYPNYLTAIPGGGVFFFGNDSLIGNELRILDIGMGVGVSAPQLEMVGKVYPNPTMGVLNIELPHGSYSLSLMDITGKLVSNQTVDVTSGMLQINRPINASQAGVYFLNIQNAEGLSQTVKVVYY